MGASVGETRRFLLIAVAGLRSGGGSVRAGPLGAAFTYQGRLRSEGAPFNSAANLVFKLYDAGSAASRLGTHAFNGVVVSGGFFTVQLTGAGEFGAHAFNGEGRWAEFAVNGTSLTPRHELASTPYATLAARARFSAQECRPAAGGACSPPASSAGHPADRKRRDSRAFT